MFGVDENVAMWSVVLFTCVDHVPPDSGLKLQV